MTATTKSETTALTVVERAAVALRAECCIRGQRHDQRGEQAEAGPAMQGVPVEGKEHHHAAAQQGDTEQQQCTVQPATPGCGIGFGVGPCLPGCIGTEHSPRSPVGQHMTHGGARSP